MMKLHRENPFRLRIFHSFSESSHILTCKGGAAFLRRTRFPLIGGRSASLGGQAKRRGHIRE